jgi:L-ascorbate metabolism protein UlaG (beta-lactamase superfamily)
MIVFLLILVLAVLSIFVAGASFSGPRYNGPVSDHFDGKKFFTPNAKKPAGLGDVLKWITNRQKGEWKENVSADYGVRPLTHEKDHVRITFINHSTFLIQVDGVNILTDPIYSKRASPFTWAGPKRMRLPGIKFEDLPRIHVVLLSHNHYDHLNIQTVRTIFGGHHPQFITPLGVKAFLEEEKIKGATDLDWWQSVELKNSIVVQAVPAQHFSGRGLLDRDASLWCGYMLRTSKGTIYFAGDSGYNEHIFKEIGEKTGPIRISILPIGAYKPYWFMSAVHTSPEDAVKAHIDVKSQNSIASHFGTFPLADEGLDEPKRDLGAALGKYNINERDFVTLKEGEVKIFE